MKNINSIKTIAAAIAALTAGSAIAGPDLTSRGEETEMDLPGSFHKYYGQNVTYYRDKERLVAKIDVDTDLNYDGHISNTDPADGGAFEHTPPGLVVGQGELAKLILRLSPYRIDFQGEVVVSLELAGINRSAKSGQFESLADEVASTGRIRVYTDPEKKNLILDSAIPEKRLAEFVIDQSKYPANIPGLVPRLLYVEGVKQSGQYSGDVRLLTTVSHREHGTTAETYAEKRKSWPKTFRTSFDHMLFTVSETPMKKEFINNNAEGVWINPSNNQEK